MRLSRQQQRVVALVAAGLSAGEIAYALGISPRTVTSCITKACRRNGLRREQVVIRWLRGAYPR